MVKLAWTEKLQTFNCKQSVLRTVFGEVGMDRETANFQLYTIGPENILW